jgi:hypothetical protein
MRFHNLDEVTSRFDEVKVGMCRKSFEYLSNFEQTFMFLVNQHVWFVIEVFLDDRLLIAIAANYGVLMDLAVIVMLYVHVSTGLISEKIIL